MKRKLQGILLYALLPVLFLTAQEGSIAIIEYIEGDPFEVIIQTPSGEEEEAYIGGELALGSTVRTGSANVEIRLAPNGTIFNLGENTVFVINAIQGRQESEETSLSLFSGRLRTVASRLGRDNRYVVNTPTSVCGIRGTEILNTVLDNENSILCKSGLVDVISLADPANRTQISANMRVDTGAALFTPVILTAGEVNAAFDALPFRKLNPRDVPGQAMENPPAGAEPEETASESEPVEVSPESAPPVPEPAETGEEETAASDRAPSKLEQWFSDHMNLTVGSLTINGETWAQAVAQPVFLTGKVRLGLYLPIVYQENFLDSSDWYQPEGNNEWSFGGDQSGMQDIFFDINRDLWLKVRFFEYGDQGWDPFYLKVGNLETITLGHGSLVRNYSNNTSFPAVRMAGINGGVTWGGLQLEALVDHAPSPSLMGGRVQIRKGKLFSPGAAAVVDLVPASDADDPESLGDPYLVGGSLDLEFFSFNTALLKLKTYGDISSVIPLYRNQPVGTAFNTSDPFKLIWDGEELSNFGVKTGMAGQVTMLDFILDLRYEDGLYRHNLFDNLYQRNRLSYLVQMNQYLESPENTDASLGVFGEAGFRLFQEKIRISAGYLWPWELDGKEVSISDEDYFRLALEISRGMIPFYNLSGSISYERARFYPSLRDGDFIWMNEDSLLTGEVVLPVAPTLDLAVIVSSSTIYDDQGDLVMKDDGITPEIVPVFTIETRIHF